MAKKRANGEGNIRKRADGRWEGATPQVIIPRQASGSSKTSSARRRRNARRSYEKAAPPREYAAMLLMKAATARVTNQGINKFGTLYTDTELAYYVNQKVNIKWDIDDVTKLYVYDMDGKKICEAVSAELLAFGPHCSQAALEKHLRDQKRNEREVREYLEERVRPYELRLEDGARPSDAVGMIDLTIKAAPSQKLVSLPKDRMFRSEQASKASRKKVTDDTFLNAKGDKALSLLRAMNE